MTFRSQFTNLPAAAIAVAIAVGSTQVHASSFPQGYSADVSGLTSGMHSATALEMISAQSEREGATTAKVNSRFQRDETVFLSSAWGSSPEAFGNRSSIDLLAAGFSSHLSGEELFYASRVSFFAKGKEADTEQTLENVRAKYGEPSIVRTKNDETTLAYFFKDGKQLSGDDKEARGCSAFENRIHLQPGRWSMQNRGENFILDEAFRRFQVSTRNGRCDAILAVTLEYGRVDGLVTDKLVQRINVSMHDHKRFVENQQAEEAALKAVTDKITNEVRSTTGGADF